MSKESLLAENGKVRQRRGTEYYSQHAGGQQPENMVVFCSDSRVVPLAETRPGVYFVGRNIANTVNDLSESMSRVIYAVNYLKVKSIIVCGHYGCGGVGAAMAIARNESEAKSSEKELKDYLKPLVHLYQQNKASLDGLEPPVRYQRFVELCVARQLNNLFAMPVVRDALNDSTHPLSEVGGVVYDLNDGQLHDLDDIVKQLPANEVYAEFIIVKAITGLSDQGLEGAIKQQMEALLEKSQSYNPFKFIGALKKADAIAKAVNSAKEDGTDLSGADWLTEKDNALVAALNSKRLTPFSFFSQGKLFSDEATSLAQVRLAAPSA